LHASGHVYRDYSTEAERSADKLAAERDKRAYRFRRQPISEKMIQQFEAEGRRFALRFHVPPGRTLVLHDLIKGDVVLATDEIGDFPIVRPDGTPLYNFASAVDDAEMRITHVVRADEHLSNTFPQLLIFEALGADVPAFAHVPFVAEPGSKSKMSKRKIAEYEKLGILVYVHQYIEKGYLPDALVNYLARLGWSYDASQEIFKRPELIEKFSLEKVNSAPASHDQDKLFWIEGEWMRTLSIEQKVEGVLPFLKSEGLLAEPLLPSDRTRIEAVIVALGDRLKVFSDILKLGRFFFTDEVILEPEAAKKRLRKEGVASMLSELERLLSQVEPFDQATLEKAVHEYAERTGRKMGDVVNPLRVAVTGQGVGPGLYDCLVILGRDAARSRIRQTCDVLGQT
jgi:glutamyl-tRNA synthetase